MLVLMLPFPPSVNQLWRFARGRMYRSAVYKFWADDAERHLQAQGKPETVTYKCALEIAVGRPDRRRRDIDNVNKAVLDLLQHCGVLADDSLVQDLRTYWSDEVVGVQVIIKQLEKCNEPEPE